MRIKDSENCGTNHNYHHQQNDSSDYIIFNHIMSTETKDRSPLGSDTRRSIQNTSNNHAGSPLNTTATNGYDPKLGIKETNLLPTSQTSRLEEQQQTSIHQAYSAQPQENFHGYNSQPQSYPNNNNPQFQQQHRQQNGWHGNNNKSPWIHPTNGHSPLLTPTSGKSFSTPGPTSSLGSGGVSPSGSRSLTGSNDSLLSDGSGGSHNNSSTGGGYPKRHPSLPPKESSIRNSGSSLRSTSTAGSGYLGGASQTSPQSAGSAGSPSSTTGHYPFTQPPINRRESQLSAYERHGSMHNNLSSDDGGLNSPASGRTSTSSISDIDKLAQELSMSSLSGAAPPKFIRDTTSYWYKPDITREQALAMLRDRSAGSFVVRNSRCYPGAFGLALKVDQVPQAVLATAKPGTNMSDELVRHFLIEPSTRGVKLKGCANEPVFGSLSALIYQHSITPLALPCKLIISAENQKVPQLSGSSRNSAEVSNSAAELLRQGAACNVLYLGSADTESLTGPEAIERAMRERMQNKGQAIKTSVVHFKVSPQGITLTDNARKIFFRRHYPTTSVTYCGLDPSAREPHNRRWDASGDRGPPNARVFAFVAKKTSNSAVNVCHLFAELDLDQPAPAIVNFVSKVLIGNSARK